MAMTEDHLDEPAITEPELALGERLALARRRAGRDQAQMADALGVSRPLISKWERGKSLPDVMQAAKWAELTGTSFGWLAGVSTRSRCFPWLTSPAAQDGQMTLALGIEPPALAVVAVAG